MQFIYLFIYKSYFSFILQKADGVWEDFKGFYLFSLASYIGPNIILNLLKFKIYPSYYF